MKIETVTRLYSDIALYKVVQLDRFNHRQYKGLYIVDYSESSAADHIRAHDIQLFYKSPVQALYNFYTDYLNNL